MCFSTIWMADAVSKRPGSWNGIRTEPFASLCERCDSRSREKAGLIGFARIELDVIESDVLLRAYRHGIFPMAINSGGELGWFSPDPRALIPLDVRFHIPHGLERALK